MDPAVPSAQVCPSLPTEGAAPERRRNGSRSRSRGSRVEPAGARDAAERASQLEKMPMQLEKPYQAGVVSGRMHSASGRD